MSVFVNTVDVIGDEALTKSIIDRSITEFVDNNVKKIGKSAFYACNQLTTVVCPEATSIENEAFHSCSVLTMADFTAVTNLKSSCFYGCKALTALILRRSAAAVTLTDFGHFPNTPIASGTGYIYVPRALVDIYKAVSTWSTYAAQIRALEDYTVDGTITGALDETKI